MAADQLVPVEPEARAVEHLRSQDAGEAGKVCENPGRNKLMAVEEARSIIRGHGHFCEEVVHGLVAFRG